MRGLEEAKPLILVTGPSGAGRSTAIHALEDLGYEAIDNLPLRLMPRLLAGKPLSRPLALGLDTRNRDFSVNGFMDALDQLVEAEVYNWSLLYLDARADVLIRRFSTTRRRHPLAPDETPQIGIEREFNLLKQIRERADILIDTSDISPHDLRSDIASWAGQGKSGALAVSLHSFSYKRGIPRGVDMVLDLRFLKNPYWEPALRDHDGRDPKVADYIKSDARFEAIFQRSLDMLSLLLPAYQQEGKAHFAIGLGCTGGRHRSVAFSEALAKGLSLEGWAVRIRHRELDLGGFQENEEGQST